MIEFKRGYWYVLFQGRKFKRPTEEAALEFLELLEKEGLPKR